MSWLSALKAMSEQEPISSKESRFELSRADESVWATIMRGALIKRNYEMFEKAFDVCPKALWLKTDKEPAPLEIMAEFASAESLMDVIEKSLKWNRPDIWMNSISSATRNNRIGSLAALAETGIQSSMLPMPSEGRGVWNELLLTAIENTSGICAEGLVQAACEEIRASDSISIEERQRHLAFAWTRTLRNMSDEANPEQERESARCMDAILKWTIEMGLPSGKWARLALTDSDQVFLIACHAEKTISQSLMPPEALDFVEEAMSWVGNVASGNAKSFVLSTLEKTKAALEKKLLSDKAESGSEKKSRRI